MTITLYANSKIVPDKNFAVESIENYLSTFSNADVLVISNQNYFKQKLNTSILLDLGQEALNYYNKHFNYCKIQNGTDQEVYYFIYNLEWRSKEVVYLSLYQDTVATLGILPLTDKTLVHREHKDRMTRLSASRALPLVDKTPEGIAPILYKNDEHIISKYGQDDNIDYRNRKWYLAYINTNDIVPTDYNQANPVKMFIIPDKGTTVGAGDKAEVTIESSWGEFIIAGLPLKNGSGNNYVYFKVNISSDSYKIAIDYEDERDYLYATFLMIKRENNTLIVKKCISTYDSQMQIVSSNIISTATYNTTKIDIQGAPAYVAIYTSPNLDFYNNGSYLRSIDNAEPYACIGIDDLNLTDAKLVKIIELPYCPLNIYTTGGLYGITFRENIELVHTDAQGSAIGEAIVLRTGSYGGNYKKELKSNYDFDLVPSYPFEKFDIDPSAEFRKINLKNKKYEYKLYHSELFNQKFVYDSFSSLIQFENIEYTTGLMLDRNHAKFTFVASTNISSKFLFDFSATFPQKGGQDYSNILIVSRNNEYPIYTNQYINYLRTGYNYDLKARERQETVGAITAILGIAGRAANIASMNSDNAVGEIIGGVTGIASSIVNNINTSIANTQAIEQKQAQLKNQSVSVQTSDDLSLLDYYTKCNKAKYVIYKPSEAMEENLYNLFFYTGYKVEKMEKPNLQSRLRFNFIQADIDLDLNEAVFNTLNVSKEIIDDYKGRFAIGLTLFHYYNNEYDFEQKYENWESIFENEIL